jgi:hypothetical protein
MASELGFAEVSSGQMVGWKFDRLVYLHLTTLPLEYRLTISTGAVSLSYTFRVIALPLCSLCASF